MFWALSIANWEEKKKTLLTSSAEKPNNLSFGFQRCNCCQFTMARWTTPVVWWCGSTTLVSFISFHLPLFVLFLLHEGTLLVSLFLAQRGEGIRVVRSFRFADHTTCRQRRRIFPVPFSFSCLYKDISVPWVIHPVPFSETGTKCRAVTGRGWPVAVVE